VPTLTITGLGPGAFGDLTIAALDALQTARRILFRTADHPSIPPLLARIGPDHQAESCDDLYETLANFADVYAAVVARVLAIAAREDLVYAVPGHPWVGEATTSLLLSAAAARGIDVQVIGGLSFVEGSFAAAGIDLMDGAQVVDAMLLARQHYPQVEPRLPLLAAQLFARWLASDLKLVLLNAYPAGHPVTIVRSAGTVDQALTTLPLEELDRGDHFDHLTSLFVPPLAEYSAFSSLQELVAHLRAPEGCPWDREQTLASLRNSIIDEAAEVVEAIDAEEDGRDNSLNIAEELGDLMLVATMLIQIAGEEGRFQMSDVMRNVVTKLIRRHPHVFSSTVVSGVDHVLANWDAIKVQEKAAKGVVAGPLDGVPAALPALEKARMLQSKAHKAGLLDRSAVAAADPALYTLLEGCRSEAALGELLWQIVAASHGLDINPEDALRAYAGRFREMHQR
jgi:tetrapyrrole methylase family protein/MazG family protein